MQKKFVKKFCTLIIFWHCYCSRVLAIVLFTYEHSINYIYRKVSYCVFTENTKHCVPCSVTCRITCFFITHTSRDVSISLLREYSARVDIFSLKWMLCMRRYRDAQFVSFATPSANVRLLASLHWFCMWFTHK